MSDPPLNDLSLLLGAADDPKIAWFFTLAAAVLGASVGSFLNVVVYRLPRGLSLSHPGSRCPHCLHPIRWFDNVPVLGWIWLGGRCRDCHAPIAVRYPLVEALVAVLAAGLFWLEVVERGANLPASDILGETPLALPWLRYAYHLLLALTLVAAGFMSYDRQRLPLSLWAPALVVGFVAPLIWPELRPAPAFIFLQAFTGPIRGAVDGLVGISLSANLGFMAVGPWRSFRSQRPFRRQGKQWTAGLSSDERRCSLEMRDQALLSCIVGLFLGWQFAWIMLLPSLLFEWLFNLVVPAGYRNQAPLPVWSSIVALALLLNWRGASGWIELTLGGTLGGFVLFLVSFVLLANLAAIQRTPPIAPARRDL